MTQSILVLNDSQHGFVPGKSINTNLMELVLFANEAFENKCQIDVLYTDFSRAFEKLFHSILIRKMIDLGFESGLIKWIASYLHNRLMKVKINGVFSNAYKMNTGVPAGSILGPVLFLIFINDIPPIFEKYCKVLLFADDCKLMMQIKNEDDAGKFQFEINKFSNWCAINRLQLNISKCAILTIGRIETKIENTYTLNGYDLNRVKEFRDLGVIIDDRLTFKKHLETLVSNCNSTLRFIKLTVGRNFDTDTLVILFNSFVLSKLLFAMIVWYPFSAGGQEFIEGVQKRFTMMALREWPNKKNNFKIRPYHERCRELKINTIYARYVFVCRIFIYDIMSGRLKSETMKNKIMLHNNRQTRITELITVPKFKNDYMQNQPFWSAVRHFNSSRTEYINNENDRNKYIKVIKSKL